MALDFSHLGDAVEDTVKPDFSGAGELLDLSSQGDPVEAEAPRRAAGFFGGASEGFVEGVASAPETAGAGIEAYGRASGIGPLQRAGEYVQETTKRDPASAPEMVLLRDAFDPSGLFVKGRTFIGQQLGNALGSSVITLLTGGAGAVAGGAAAGPPGAIAGGLLGAASSALPLNTGDLYMQLQEEGIDKDQAAKLAAWWGPVLTAPDVFSASTLLKPFLGTAKKEGVKGLVSLLAKRVKEGATVEGLTEAGQQGVQEAIAGAATGNPDLVNRAERVATAGIGGGLGGGGTGLVGGGVERVRGRKPAPAAGTDTEGAPAADAGTAAPDAGMVFGLRRPDAPPERGVVEQVQDGYVFWRDEQNQRRVDALSDFQRDATVAPPPVDTVQGDATIVPPADIEQEATPPDVQAEAFDLQRDQDVTAVTPPERRDGAEVQVLRLRERAADIDRRVKREQTKAAKGAPGALTQDAIQSMRGEAESMRTEADRIASQPAPDMPQPELDLRGAVDITDPDIERDAIQQEPTLEDSAAPAEQSTAETPSSGGTQLNAGLDPMQVIANFKKWFGKSKIVNERGDPQVVYHGTADDVSEFDLDHPHRKDSGWLGSGVYLTTDRQLASMYPSLKAGDQPNVMPLHARLENPYYATLKDKKRLMLYAHAKGRVEGRRAADAWTQQLKDQGYDGVILKYDPKDVGEANASSEIVVFDPAAVKSVFNQGEYSRTNSSVLHSGLDPFDAVRMFRETLKSMRARLLNSAGRTATNADIQTSAKQANALPKTSPSELRHLSRSSLLGGTAPGIASLSRIGSKYFSLVMNKKRLTHALTNEAAPFFKDYNDRPSEQTDIDAVLEHDKITGTERRNNGRRVVVQMPDDYKGKLAKPGQMIHLSDGASKALFRLREFFDRRLFRFAEGMAREQGYTGPFTDAYDLAGRYDPNWATAAIRAAITAHPASSKPEERAKERALMSLEIADNDRRRGYVPFGRYGNWYVKVVPKASQDTSSQSARDAMPETTLFETIDSQPKWGGILTDRSTDYPVPVNDRIKELRAQYPDSQYTLTHGQVRPDIIQALNIPDMEKLMMALNYHDPAIGQKLYDEIMATIYDRRLASWRKQAKNIAGYSTDFIRSMGDYVRSTAGVISNMEYSKQIQQAYDETQTLPDPHQVSYWNQFNTDINSRGSDASTLRRFAFFTNIAGSMATAMSNLAQTPLVTATQVGLFAGQLRGQALAHGAALEAASALRIGARGLTIDVSKVGRTDAEKRMLGELDAEGFFDPVISDDIRGTDITKNPRYRAVGRFLSRADDIYASAFSAAEMINRIGAALAYFRASQYPPMREKAAKVFAQDQLWQARVGPSMNPIDIAKFGVDETQGIGGKEGRSAIARAAGARGVGALALQFKTYPILYMRLLHKNMTRMGPEGKFAAGMMLAGLTIAGGLGGWPFADDLINIGEGIYHGITGIDPMIERKFASWLRSAGLGDIESEAALKGISRELFGVDASQRLGFGNILPEPDLLQALPIFSSTVGKMMQWNERAHTGQPMSAAADFYQFLFGKGVSDAYRGMAVLPEEGKRTIHGYPVTLPSEITGGEMAAQTLGFVPTSIARKTDESYSQNRVKNATRVASTRLITAISADLTTAEDAASNKDFAKASEYERRADEKMQLNAEILEDESVPDWKKIPQPKAEIIKQRIRQFLSPSDAAVKGAGRLKREEMQQYPLPAR